MDSEPNEKPSVAGYLAVGAGILTAFGCGVFLSEPVESFDAARGEQVAQRPEIVPTAYQTVEGGGALPAQIGGPDINKRRAFGPPPEIVIKLKDKAKAKEICDAFWKDKETARQKFESVVANNPALRGLNLKRVTYSNEFVVDFGGDFQGNTEAVKTKFAKAVKALETMQGVSYAEPNATAQPGKR